MNYFATATSFPPSFGGDRVAYAASVFGLLGSALLAAEWIWRLTWDFVDRPAPLNEPITITRIVLFGLLSATLCRITPDVFLVMLWPEISPATRATLAFSDRILDGVSIAPMTIAWGVGIFGASTVQFQLIRQPLPVDLWPSWRRMKRPLMIGTMILAIALCLAFLR